MEMNEELFDNIINTAQDCVFWKDKDRRFVGVNKAFLDFYGFASADVLIGKTDEDMGWHSDPEPFKQDELRVLEGQSTYKVLGKCMIRGEERDIIASKRPIYEDGKIVGLVGSFLDVTDVHRRNQAASHSRVNYDIKKLRKYRYFDKLLDEVSLEEILDPLTGVVSRGFILNFAKSLISDDIPFTFSIIDLDNFKYINDTYGHHAGDVVLEEIAGSLAEYTDGYGVVGRFGGDELLLINFRDTKFDDKQSFFEDIYVNTGVLRRKIDVDDHSLFITGTTGCATFPYDADNYDDLFSLIDKTLYHGKSKGRNCFVIYEESIHKDLDMKKIVRQGIYTNMNTLMSRIEQVKGFENRLLSVMNLLQTELSISEIFYCGKGLMLRSLIDKSLRRKVNDLICLMNDDLYAESDIENLKGDYPVLYDALKVRNVHSALIVKIGLNAETDGYLICASSREHRIWQEDECGILYFIAKSLAAYIRLSGETIPE
ncbi:MAG: GGDEF domain-containing protein [Lachnospiraceae bacterium]|nr:GGDEF domain-containing protein [Lachnospiraceae bacterium]